VANPKVTDYYSVLNLPTGADFIGVQNAYARLSRELADMGQVDEASSEALQQLNEAYSVLSRPELRREYDLIFLAADREREARAFRAVARRRSALQWAILGALGIIVTAQAAALAYLGREQVAPILSAILGPLWPG
jgi:curved DNA-binding protein CbpA